MAKSSEMFLRVPHGHPGAPLAANKLLWKRRATVAGEMRGNVIQVTVFGGPCNFSGLFLSQTGLRSVQDEYNPEKNKALRKKKS